ncbi:hypothetical protein GOA89_14675 [Sinorhizobium meliloti]|nr:hypothetical protein [Sinorhizobium meliloti]MDW9847541.1 hypothetical protein [Sinorhizobium meliloti]MDX0144076.1 hypothetical protein [Sinorhizobium meliloti]MDX0150501.1 hypothetical protein [Sinorhizobium meliloti]MDX0169719.1 hypothetical protein [Sinorhizobium meliloti]
MLKSWVESGLDPSLFWALTLREIGAILDGAVSKLKREREAQMSIAWHTAYMTAYAPQKPRQFWKLKELLGDHSNKPTGRRMTPEEIEAITRGWLASRHRKGNHGR